jgi:hypothetical protein
VEVVELCSGGGGAGGYRTSFPGGTKLKIGAGAYPITVGAGGAAGLWCKW